MKPNNHLAGLGKLLQKKADGLVMNQFTTTIAISKRANANLGIKISKHTRLNEINLKSWVAFIKPYILKRAKMSWLKFVTEHIIWTEERWDCAHFSDESNLFGWFVRRSPKEYYLPQCAKSSVKFGGGSVMVFGMISLLVQYLLLGYTVKIKRDIKETCI